MKKSKFYIFLFFIILICGQIKIYNMENESNISKKTGTYINTEDNKRINTNVINVDCIKLQFKQIKNEMVSVVNDDIVEENENILIEDIESEKKNDNTFGKTTFDDKRFIEYGGAEVEKKIIVGEIELPLYPTFSSSTKSIKTVKIKCKKVIELLKNKYNLSDFSEENWKEYYYSMNLYFDEKNKVEWYSENNKTVSELQVFFDIYENYEENDKLINITLSFFDCYMKISMHQLFLHFGIILIRRISCNEIKKIV